MREALEGLDTENLRAWQLMRSQVTRFAIDTQVFPQLLMRLTAEDDPEELEDLMIRLAIIYDIQCPPPKKGDG